MSAFVLPLLVQGASNIFSTAFSSTCPKQKGNVSHTVGGLPRLQVCMSNPSATRLTAPPTASNESKTFICTSLIASTLSEQLAQSRSAADAGADIVEIRVDLLCSKDQPEWHRLLPALTVPAIVTNRAEWEGGMSKLSEEQRLRVLVDSVQRGVSHVDVELKAVDDFIHLCRAEGIQFPLKNTKLILSHHDFKNSLSLDEISNIIDRMRRTGANVCKVAMMAQSALDNIVVFQSLARTRGDCIVLAMGELGQVSRIAAAKYGAYLTFASVAKGDESAPGQVDVATMVDTYRFHSMTRDTPLYGVIGDPVSHSMSPAVHNTAMQLRDIRGTYVPLRVEGQYDRFVREITKQGFEGLSVTIPGKVEVIKAMDEMDNIAEQIGAMNTVVKTADGRLKGYNTDWVAAISAIEEKFEHGLYDKRVVCVGAGGAGRALAFGALARGASHVFVVNRSYEKAEALANVLGDQASSIPLEEFNEHFEEPFDVLINSTSVGMHPKEDDIPVSPSRLHNGIVVFDAVYNPLRTRLLQEANERGCITVSGLEMFVRQAAEQFHLWFPNSEFPTSEMRELVTTLLNL